MACYCNISSPGVSLTYSVVMDYNDLVRSCAIVTAYVALRGKMHVSHILPVSVINRSNSSTDKEIASTDLTYSRPSFDRLAVDV